MKIKWGKIILILNILISIGCYIAGVKFAKKKAQEFANRYDAVLDTGFIYPSLSGIVFNNVYVNACGSSVNAKFNKIIIKTDNFSPKFIEVKGGHISATGDLNLFKSCKKSTISKSKSQIQIKGENIDVNWTDGLRDVKIHGVSFKRDSGEIDIDLKDAVLKDVKFQIEIKDLHTDFDNTVRIKKMDLKLSNDLKSIKSQNQSEQFSFVQKFEKINNILFGLPKGSYLDIDELRVEIFDKLFGPMKLKFWLLSEKLDFQIEYNGEKFSELFDISESSINFAFKFKNHMFDGNFDIKPIVLYHPVLGDFPIKFPNLSFSTNFYVADDMSYFDIKSATVRLNKIDIYSNGILTEIPSTKRWSEFVAKFNVALLTISCFDVIKSLPDDILGILAGVNTNGSILSTIKIDYNSKYHDKAEVDLIFKNKCDFGNIVPALDISKFRKVFKHKIYTSNGKIKEITLGPGTREWTPLGSVSPFVEFALLVREDPGFRSHRGILVEALSNSIRDNLRTGKFLRGGSTITMQLARNLWLTRKKNLVRKFQEIMLATYLEQYMSKEEILELYLNVIEYGPDLYGIGPASKYYFKTNPASLTLSQSVFLVSILSNPKKPRFTAEGPLHPGHLSTLHLLMKMMYERKLISKEQLDHGLSEVPVFGKSDPILSSRDGIVEIINDED